MRRITLLLLFVTFCAQTGCKDPVVKVTEPSEINEWVYSVMKANYLWSDQLKPIDQTSPATATQTYFDVNLRYRENTSVELKKDILGDRFSKIAPTDDARSIGDEAAAATEKDYNFGFFSVSVTYFGSDRVAFLQVLYVVPGSPADKAGLRRGDSFADNIGTDDDVYDLLSQQEITLKITNRDKPTTIKIAKGSFYNNPVFYHDVLTAPGGQKVGYLVYNHFTGGDATGEANYATQLKEVFRDFKNKGATKLILDLRYNGGGEVSNAQLLASLIVPAANLGKTWMYAERHDHSFEEYHFLSASELGGSNANIEELYVITSPGTASASELIIHTLRSFYGDKLHVTGYTTVGKNLGSREFTKKGIAWVMNPITMRVYNKEKESGYEGGIPPDVELKEYQYLSAASYYLGYFDIFPLGDIEREWLLNKVMSNHFGVKEAKYYVPAGRSAVHSFEATANVPERGLTETPQREQ